MATRVRRSTNAQGDRQIIRYKQVLSGGLNVDQNPATLGTGQFAGLTNMVVQGELLSALQAARTTLDLADGEVAAAGAGSAQGLGEYLWQVHSIDDGVTWYVSTYHKDVDSDTWAWHNKGYFTPDAPLAASSIRAVQYFNGILLAAEGRLRHFFFYLDPDVTTGSDHFACHIATLNDAAPTTPWLPLDFANSGYWQTAVAGTDYLYYWVYTLVEKAPNGVILWESLPLQLIGADGNAVSAGFGTADTPDAWVGASVFFDLSKATLDSNAGTHIRLYRTLDMVQLTSDSPLFTAASAQSYRLVAEREIAGDLTQTIAFNVDADAMMMSDADLVAYNPPIYAGMFRTPLPVGSNAVLAYGEGFVWTSDEHTAYYSQAAAYPQHAGLYFTGAPSPIVERDDVTDVRCGSGYALVCTSHSVRRVSTQNVTTFDAVGAVGTIFTYTPYATENWGITLDRRDACDTIGTEMVMFGSDSQVRVYSGSAFGEPISAGKVSKILRDVLGPCLSVYSPEGWWQVMWSSTGTGAPDLALRCMMQESGRPWSRVEWADATYLKPFFIPSAFFTDATLSGVLAMTGLYDADVEGSANTFSLFSMTSFSDSVKDLPWSMETEQWGGEYDGYLVQHKETTLTTNGTFAAGTFQLLADENAVEPSGHRRGYAQRIELGSGQADVPLSIVRSILNVRWCQVRLTGSDTTRFQLTKMMSVLSAQDRPFYSQSVLALEPGVVDRIRLTPASGIYGSLVGSASDPDAAIENGDWVGTPTFSSLVLASGTGPMIDCTDGNSLSGTASLMGAGCYARLATGIDTDADADWTIAVGLWLDTSDLPFEIAAHADSAYRPLLAIGNRWTMRLRSYDNGGDNSVEVSVFNNRTGATIASTIVEVIHYEAMHSNIFRIEAVLTNDAGTGLYIRTLVAAIDVDTELPSYDVASSSALSCAPAPTHVIVGGGFGYLSEGELVPKAVWGASVPMWDVRVGGIDEVSTPAQATDNGYLADVRNNRGEIYIDGVVLG